MQSNTSRTIVALVLIVVVLALALILGATVFREGENGLHFKIVGQTASDRYYGGTLHSESSGFTPRGSYETLVWAPDGQPYNGTVVNGLVDDYGRVSNWSWAAGGQYYYGSVDSAGKYRVVIIDLATGRATKPVHFTVERKPAFTK